MIVNKVYLKKKKTLNILRTIYLFSVENSKVFETRAIQQILPSCKGVIELSIFKKKTDSRIIIKVEGFIKINSLPLVGPNLCTTKTKDYTVYICVFNICF